MDEPKVEPAIDLIKDGTTDKYLEDGGGGTIATVLSIYEDAGTPLPKEKILAYANKALKKIKPGSSIGEFYEAYKAYKAAGIELPKEKFGEAIIGALAEYEVDGYLMAKLSECGLGIVQASSVSNCMAEYPKSNKAKKKKIICKVNGLLKEAEVSIDFYDVLNLHNYVRHLNEKAEMEKASGGDGK